MQAGSVPTDRVEIGADGCGCPVTVEVTVVDGELRSEVEGTERTEHWRDCWLRPRPAWSAGS